MAWLGKGGKFGSIFFFKSQALKVGVWRPYIYTVAYQIKPCLQTQLWLYQFATIFMTIGVYAEFTDNGIDYHREKLSLSFRLTSNDRKIYRQRAGGVIMYERNKFSSKLKGFAFYSTRSTANPGWFVSVVNCTVLHRARCNKRRYLCFNSIDKIIVSYDHVLLSLLSQWTVYPNYYLDQGLHVKLTESENNAI